MERPYEHLDDYELLRLHDSNATDLGAYQEKYGEGNPKTEFKRDDFNHTHDEISKRLWDRRNALKKIYDEHPRVPL